jgi:hypothetical protein
MGELLLGALVGAVVSLSMTFAFERPISSWLDRRRVARNLERRQRQLRSARGQFDVAGESVVVGSDRVYVLAFDPSGLDRVHLQPGRAAAGPTPADSTAAAQLLGLEPTEIDDRVERRRAELQRGDQEWNGRRWALRSASVSREGAHEDVIVRLGFAEAEYARFDVLTRLWEERQRLPDPPLTLAEDLRRVWPALSNSFGVSATVRTADDKLILTRRSPRTNSGRSALHVSLNEGMDLVDVDSERRPDPMSTLVRGAFEELGIVIEESSAVIHAVILDVTRYQWGALGHVDLSGTSLTSHYVRQARALGKAKDDWESSELIMVDYTLPDVLARLTQPDTQWVAHGWVNLACTALTCWPTESERIVSALLERSSPTRA